MKEQTTTAAPAGVQTAAISDRGLSEKRPLNEDSYLCEPARHIFAVADGVGGAQAGEVASQAAVEVLDEAFSRHEDGTDVEDLMELAIQRANASIHQMSRNNTNLATMATTIVALHLDGQIATIGHVGDSRLYRIKPDGTLLRETADHSVVEEEVRAGRMTAEQAANHPSRNVISRALGAEPGVEVDTKMIEFDTGTTFLLCSDGITRHIPDSEIREILTSGLSLDDMCAEMKRRCYERGAEDNLTAVLIRTGAPNSAGLPLRQDEDAPTIQTARGDGSAYATHPGLARTRELPAAESAADVAAAPPQADGGPRQQATAAGASQLTSSGLTPPSRIVFPPASASPEIEAAEIKPAAETHTTDRMPAALAHPLERPAKSGGAWRTLAVLLLVAGVGAGAFFAGRYQAQQEASVPETAATQPPAAQTAPNPEADFDRRRRDVDREPAAAVRRMEATMRDTPPDQQSPEDLYLYGRALLLTNQHDRAGNMFKQAVEKMKERPGRDSLKIETKLSAAAAALRSGNWTAAQVASKDLEEVFEMKGQSAGPLQLDGGQTPPADAVAPAAGVTPQQ